MAPGATVLLGSIAIEPNRWATIHADHRATVDLASWMDLIADAGFDGVEVWAAYHGMLDQFWTPWSNRRDDRWGGTFENRMRFSSEILGGIRRAVGDDFIIGLATSVDPTVDVAMRGIAA